MLSKLIGILGGVAIDATRIAVAANQSQQPARRRKAGCTPCEAAKRIDKMKANIKQVKS